MNFSAFIFLVDTFIMALFNIRAFRFIKKEVLRKKYIKSYKEASNLPAHYFFNTVFILMLGYIIFTVILLFFSGDKIISRNLKIVGDFFLFSSYAYGINIPLSLKFPRINRKIFVGVLLFFSWAVVFYQFFYYPSPEIVGGLVFWNLDPLVSIILYTYALVMWVPTGIIFILEGFKNREEFFKYLFLGLSFIIISIFGPLMLVTYSAFWVVVSHIFMTIGFVLVFLGMFYRDLLKSYKFFYDRYKTRS